MLNQTRQIALRSSSVRSVLSNLRPIAGADGIELKGGTFRRASRFHLGCGFRFFTLHPLYLLGLAAASSLS
jgi:hypothetical protein